MATNSIMQAATSEYPNLVIFGIVIVSSFSLYLKKKFNKV
ncbi:MAG TPA: hypothetical protein DEQ24_07090 [Enterococcus sp.]|nr:hypothetical protein [Enterococcus sp.]